MPRVLQPWQLLVTILAGWVNEHQQAAIENLREENRILKEQLGGKRLRLTDGQPRRLAAKGKALGREALKEIASIVRESGAPGLSYDRGQPCQAARHRSRAQATAWDVLKTLFKAHWDSISAAASFTLEVWGLRR